MQLGCCSAICEGHGTIFFFQPSECWNRDTLGGVFWSRYALETLYIKFRYLKYCYGSNKRGQTNNFHPCSRVCCSNNLLNVICFSSEELVHRIKMRFPELKLRVMETWMS